MCKLVSSNLCWINIDDFEKYRKNSIRWSCKQCVKKGRRSSFLVPPPNNQPQAPLLTAITSTQVTQTNGELENLKRQLDSFKEQLSSQIKTIEKRLEDEIEKNRRQNNLIDDLRDTINTLTNRPQQEETRQVVKLLEIRGLPSFALTHPIDTTIDVAKEFGIHLDRSQFSSVSDSSIVTIEFSSTLLREKFLTAGKKFNREQKRYKNKSRIFINEKLSHDEKQLLYRTKIVAQKCGYKFAWHTRGRIHLKKNEFSIPIIINNDTDLNKIQSESIALLPERERSENQNGENSQSYQQQQL
jgi:hypothetical protein